MSQSPPAKDEKTIPFLRQLTDMLQRNGEVISFVPGKRSFGQTTLGRIIVHDRSRVQSEVLPIYFNHASFASLRRQLSYFSFVRVGKGRQGGVTYTNDSVVELSDILKLKRRATGSKQMTDVASAVSNGILHAAKTNEDVVGTFQTTPLSEDRPAPSLEGALCLSERVASHVANMPRNISPPQSLKSIETSKNETISPGKQCISRKRVNPDRLDRLLYINNIVPFIHIPTRKKAITDLIVEVSENTSSLAKKARRDEPLKNEGMPCAVSTKDGEAKSTVLHGSFSYPNYGEGKAIGDSALRYDPAIHALLALGSTTNSCRESNTVQIVR